MLKQSQNPFSRNCFSAVWHSFPPIPRQTAIAHDFDAQVADGTGAPLYRANVRSRATVSLQSAKLVPKPAKQPWMPKGSFSLLVSLTFHNHSENRYQGFGGRDQVSQGITTLIIGADGESPWPWPPGSTRCRTARQPVNVGRSWAMRRFASKQWQRFQNARNAAEVHLMEESMRQEMKRGRTGPFKRASNTKWAAMPATDELVALAKIAAASGGVYMTHIRDEADKSFEALEEEIAIGERAHIP